MNLLNSTANEPPKFRIKNLAEINGTRVECITLLVSLDLKF